MIYQNANSALLSAVELYEHYNRVSEQVTIGERKLTSRFDWESDCRLLQRILQRQGEKAKHEVHHLLYGQVEDANRHLLDEVDDGLWTYYTTTSTHKEHENQMNPLSQWAVAAKHAHRAIHHMVRAILKDKE